MKHYKYVILGGGLAGARAIEGIRQEDTFGSILLVSEESSLPYDRPPLSKTALLEDIASKDIRLHSPWFYLWRRVRVLRRKSVLSLDLEPSPRRARISGGGEVSFDKLILATGARPKALDIKGCELGGYDVLRSYEDSRRIRHALLSGEGPEGKRVVIVGAGFIGLEAAASIAAMGAKVTVLELKGQVWPSVAPEPLAAFLQDWLSRKGVEFHFGGAVSALSGEGVVEEVLLSEGERIPADFVLFAVGAQPNVELAREAGITVADGIDVDETLETSSKGIFAAGDVATLPDPYANRRRRLEHYGSAEATGYLAGRNAAGAGERFSMLPYVWSDIGELRIDIAGDETGWDEYLLRGTPEVVEGEAPSFLILGLKGGKAVCYFSIDRSDAERSALQLLIKQGVSLSGKENRISDLQRPLQEIVMELMTEGEGA